MNRKILRIAHRGIKCEYPENTTENLLISALSDIDGVEIDVRLTRDLKLIIFHDPFVDRLTDKTGLVRDFSLEEIKFFKIRSPDCLKTGTIPTLPEALQILSNLECIYLDIKSMWRNDVEKMVVDVADQYNLLKKIVISSFNPNLLWRIKKYRPEVRTGFIFKSTLSRMFWRLLHSWYGNFEELHSDFNNISMKFITYARKNNYKVMAWTVNTISDMRYIIDCGVDGIITDRIDILNGVLRNL